MVHRIVKKKLKLRLKLSLLMIFIVILLIFLNFYFKPLIAVVAQSHSKSLASKFLNEAIYEEIIKENITYDNLIHINRANDNRVLSISTDTITMNTLKSSIILRAQDMFSQHETESINLPLGTLLDSSIFHGKGVNVPLRLSLEGDLFINFISNFSEAGINQTKHTVYLEAVSNISIITLSYSNEVEVKTNIPIAETVIIGVAPNSFADFKIA